MKIKIPFYYSPIFISLLSALWFLIIPIPITLFLLFKRYNFIKERENKIEKYLTEYATVESLEIKNTALNSEAEKLSKFLEDKETERQRILSEYRQEGEKEKNAIIATATDSLNNLAEMIAKQRLVVTVKEVEISKLNKEISKLEKIARQNRSEANALKVLKEHYPEITLNYDSIEKHIATNIDLIFENQMLQTIVNLHTHSDNSKELRKLSKAVKREIEQTLQEFLGRYSTKTFKSLYNMMVIGLQSESQLILSNLKFETLDNALKQVDTLIEKYIVIAGKGNQQVLPTITKFLFAMKQYYTELVNIEYKYYIKREQEKEEQRLIREQMRQEAEERKALEAERKKLEREESKFTVELQRANDLLESETDNLKIEQLKARILELEQQMNEIEEKKESIATLANGKAGYVYIISNIGSFGENVFKIGMTRRLEPQDRVDELGSASVPFKFDVHAFIFSDDAVGLEYKLHQKLSEHRVNKVNFRKEFFRTSIEDLELLVETLDPTADFTKTMLALEYNQTLEIEKRSA
ncbi:GIY-YIG nuclease family protein [Aerococcaceae bacterium NML160702]|nr:GIY-YIG nuclease family protein [Aerococcaceae bacterium NML160702]